MGRTRVRGISQRTFAAVREVSHILVALSAAQFAAQFASQTGPDKSRNSFVHGSTFNDSPDHPGVATGSC
jgi:hypothetical protein